MKRKKTNEQKAKAHTDQLIYAWTYLIKTKNERVIKVLEEGEMDGEESMKMAHNISNHFIEVGKILDEEGIYSSTLTHKFYKKIENYIKDFGKILGEITKDIDNPQES